MKRFCVICDVWNTAHRAVMQELAAMKRLRLRYFTEREVANIMGFPPRFSFPPGMTLPESRVGYRVLGNSLSVPVVTKLLQYLYRT